NAKAGEVGRKGDQKGRGLGGWRNRRPLRLERTKGRRDGTLSRRPRRIRSLARRDRSADHAGARQGRLDQGGRSSAATRRGRDGRGDRGTSLRTSNAWSIA